MVVLLDCHLPWAHGFCLGDSLKALMEDYDFPNITDSRDLNLNRFMQFCGVRYQLVD